MLYVVPTPIGNLADISLRALEVLREVDVIAAEDTRHSGMLLKHHGVSKPLLSFHEHNEAMRTAELRERLRDGSKVALITDAGMPGVSDPGMRLVRACIDEGMPYTVLPGPSAVITALVGSGFNSTDFAFHGFLPVKSGQRLNALAAALDYDGTSVFFESPHRLTKSLAALAELAPERRVCVARELTKKFEEYRTGTTVDVSTWYADRAIKGEICLVIEGTEEARKRGREAASAD